MAFGLEPLELHVPAMHVLVGEAARPKQRDPPRLVDGAHPRELCAAPEQARHDALLLAEPRDLQVQGPEPSPEDLHGPVARGSDHLTDLPERETNLAIPADRLELAPVVFPVEAVARLAASRRAEEPDRVVVKERAPRQPAAGREPSDRVGGHVALGGFYGRAQVVRDDSRIRSTSAAGIFSHSRKRR